MNIEQIFQDKISNWNGLDASVRSLKQDEIIKNMKYLADAVKQSDSERIVTPVGTEDKVTLSKAREVGI